METETTRMELQEPTDASLICSSSAEPFNATSLEATNHSESSMSHSHVRRGYNSPVGREVCSRVFVLGVGGNPLTPCKHRRARLLMEQNKAKPIWNKFGQFGIQMMVDSGDETCETVLGVDNGTKFEGYSIICGNINNFNVMWKLPDKSKLVKKLEERSRLRRARRFRNCRRRECRPDNRNKDGFIAPSQLQVVQSRLKVIKELFKCYPISSVAFEDVKFNHRDKRWGRNFTTVEVGKNMIKKFIVDRVGRKNLILFEGFETKDLRNKYGLKKLSNKSKQNFYVHCVDSFVIALVVADKQIILNEGMTYVDDNYRPVRRKLHDTQFSKGETRYKFSTGSFQGMSKGCIIGDKNGWLGQLVGGTKNTCYYQDFELQDNGRKIYQKSKSMKKVCWVSHHFKCNKINGGEIHL